MTCADATQKHTPYRHTSLKIKLNDPKNDPLEKVLVTLRGHPTVVVRRGRTLLSTIDLRGLYRRHRLSLRQSSGLVTAPGGPHEHTRSGRLLIGRHRQGLACFLVLFMVRLASMLLRPTERSVR